MTTTTIDGQELKRLAEAGLKWLRMNQQIVNAYNVFPVPDGDTGTNMVLTMQSAYDEIGQSLEKSAGKMAQALAHGALMGARGNSGVILSQIWRGFARAVDDQEVIGVECLIKALSTARDTAYKGVVRPVEGTILTVTKDIALAAKTAYEEAEKLGKTINIVEMFERIVKAADESVQRTPELLPVLKQAGVVDSGGKGLFFIFEGMLRYLHGESLEAAAVYHPIPITHFDEHVMDMVEDGQDYEVVLDFVPTRALQWDDFYAQLEQFGTSIQIGEGEGMYRVHIHVPAEKRYHPIDYAISLGQVTKVVIENLQTQMNESKPEGNNLHKFIQNHIEEGQIGVIAISPGAGISRVYSSLGAAAVVNGGQTMNPSTQEILEAIEELPTDKVIILPNNKNIIMTAQSTKSLSQKKIAVIPSRSVPQGLAAMLHWNPEGDYEEIIEEMTSSLKAVRTCEITNATRSVEMNGVPVKEGQLIGLVDGELLVSSTNLQDCCLQTLKAAQAEDYELITLFYGAGLPKEEAENIAAVIREAFPNQEVELQEGGQPHYPFIISVE